MTFFLLFNLSKIFLKKRGKSLNKLFSYNSYCEFRFQKKVVGMFHQTFTYVENVLLNFLVLKIVQNMLIWNILKRMSKNLMLKGLKLLLTSNVIKEAVLTISNQEKNWKCIKLAMQNWVVLNVLKKAVILQPKNGKNVHFTYGKITI